MQENSQEEFVSAVMLKNNGQLDRLLKLKIENKA